MLHVCKLCARTAMTHTYWLARKPGSQTEGPFLLAQLQSMFSAGQLTAAAQVCREGERDWHLLAEELEEPAPVGRSFWSTLLVATGAFAVIAAGGLWFILANAGGEISETDKATASMRQRLNGQAPDQLQSRWEEAASFASSLGVRVVRQRNPQVLELVVSGSLAEMSDYKARKIVIETRARLGRQSTVTLKDDTGKELAKTDMWSTRGRD